MRLEIFTKKNKWWIRSSANLLGFAPGPIAVAQYRPDFFGRHFGAVLRRHLEGSKAWTRGEAELFAAFVSALNKCVYWTQSHGAVASIHLGEETVSQIMEDWRSAPIREELRAMLGYLERLTLSPEEVGAKDISSLLESGLNPDAIKEAAHVCFLFSIMDRLADALGFDIPSEKLSKRVARAIDIFGYRIAAGSSSES